MDNWSSSFHCSLSYSNAGITLSRTDGHINKNIFKIGGGCRGHLTPVVFLLHRQQLRNLWLLKNLPKIMWYFIVVCPLGINFRTVWERLNNASPKLGSDNYQFLMSLVWIHPGKIEGYIKMNTVMTVYTDDDYIVLPNHELISLSVTLS